MLSIDELRLTIQKTLKSERNVSDVSFTPLSHDVELISFWEDGVRAHFAMVVSAYVSTPAILPGAVALWANQAFAAAKIKAAEEAAKRAAEAREQIKVVA